MKARTIQRLRKQIAASDYYEKRLQYWMKVSSALERFYKFECSNFFRGEAVAAVNIRRYNRDRPRVDARVEWYDSKLNNMEQ